MNRQHIKEFEKYAGKVENDLDRALVRVLRKVPSDSQSEKKHNDKIFDLIENIINVLYGKDLSYCVTAEHFVIREKSGSFYHYTIINYVFFDVYLIVWKVDEDGFLLSYRIIRQSKLDFPRTREKRKKYLQEIFRSVQKVD